MKAIAKSNIKHNGTLYQTGEVLPDMTEVELSKLVAANVVRIEGGVVAPEKPVDVTTIKADKTAENEERERVANLPIAITLGKTALIGIARANGLKIEKTATPSEAYQMIKTYRAEKNIVIEDAKTTKKEDKKADKTDDSASKTDESTPSGANSNEDLKNQDGEKVGGDAEAPTAKVE